VVAVAELVRRVGIVGGGGSVGAIAAAAGSAGWQVHRGDPGSIAAAGAGIVIVALEGDAPAGDPVLRELEAVTAPDVVLAVDAGHGSVTDCVREVGRAERIVGLHHASFVPGSAVVELVVAERSGPWALEVASGFMEALGLAAVVCDDAPGRIVDRVGRPYLVEAVRLLESGHATVAGIDAAFETSGYACGPLRLIDDIGLEVDLATDVVLYEAFDSAGRFRPPELQEALVSEGRTGRQRGRGFYRYADDGSRRPDLELAPAEQLSGDEIAERLELAVINEAYRAVEEGVATPQAVDLALHLGLGHPRGPFERVDQLGLRHVVARLHELHARTQARSGDQYEVAASLWQMATV